jgi:hypothetical protein
LEPVLFLQLLVLYLSKKRIVLHNCYLLVFHLFPPRVVFTPETLDASSWSVIFVLSTLNPRRALVF